MSKELLKRAIELLIRPYSNKSESDKANRLIAEIEAELAKPDPEPVVWMYKEESTGVVYFENSGDEDHGWIPLYTAAESLGWTVKSFDEGLNS